MIDWESILYDSQKLCCISQTRKTINPIRTSLSLRSTPGSRSICCDWPIVCFIRRNFTWSQLLEALEGLGGPMPAPDSPAQKCARPRVAAVDCTTYVVPY